jgi:hypothetical protein
MFISSMDYRKKTSLTKTNNKVIALEEAKPKTGFQKKSKVLSKLLSY